jgi:hypothetical protein
MAEWLNLIQIGMGMTRALEGLIGVNRALNQAEVFLDSLPELNFSQQDQWVIDYVYQQIPYWKSRLDLLSLMLEDMQHDERDMEAFVHDYKAMMTEIDSHMTELGKVLTRNRH